MKHTKRNLYHRISPRYAGLVGATVFFCLSLIPSLLPRTSALQGVVSGIAVAIGYGIGAIVGNLYQALQKKYFHIRPSLVRSRVIAAGLIALAGYFMIRGYHWQNEIRTLTNSQKADFFDPFVIVVVTALVGFIIIALSRKILKLSRHIAHKL